MCKCSCQITEEISDRELQHRENIETYYRNWCDKYDLEPDDKTSDAVKMIINNYLVVDSLVADIRKATHSIK